MCKESLRLSTGARAVGWHGGAAIAVFDLQSKRNMSCTVLDTGIPLWCRLIWSK